MNILIPNATSPKNTGNQALMTALVQLLRSTFPRNTIHLQGFDPTEQKDRVTSVKHSLYSWSVFANRGVISRIYRMLWLLVGIGCIATRQTQLCKYFPHELSQLFQEYLDADVVVLEPGGYLTTKPGILQTLNLWMNLVPLYIASKLQKKIIQAPCSIGPFAYPWQGKLVAKLLSQASLVLTREDHSYQFLSSQGVVAEKSNDLLLIMTAVKKQNKARSGAVGLVMRQWISASHQDQYEQHIAEAVAEYSHKTGTTIVPIIQVHSREYNDHDDAAVDRVVMFLKNKGINVLPTKIIRTPSQARSVYGKLDLLISMRMHAALFSWLSGTPAVIISDETKADGIYKGLGISRLCIPLSQMQPQTLTRVLRYFQQHKTAVQKKCMTSLRDAYYSQRILKKQFTMAVNPSVPTVTIGVSAYNEEQNITRFLQSVLMQKEEGYTVSQIIVVSDGSTDKTVENVRALKSKKIRIIDDKQRIGKSLRLNDLYHNLTTDYLIQSDADVVFGTPYVVRDMVKTLQQNPEVGLCGGNPTPIPAKTFIETGINSTVAAYQRLRYLVNNGNNPFSADGRLLGLSRKFAKKITVPKDMIANDRYAYYVCKTNGFEYAFVPSAVVYFRSPQSVKDHIRQNTRFVAAPARLHRYFPKDIIQKEERIPRYLQILVFLEQLIYHPFSLMYILILNRYCEIKAQQNERRMTALWDIAVSTKKEQPKIFV